MRPVIDRLRNPKVAASVVFVATLFMTILDSTIVNVALPSIAAQFDANTASVGAVASAYLVSLGVFIPAAGWLGDRFGGKRVLLTALVLFTVASALCGLATSLPELVVFRVLQGAGGGMLTPVGMAMLFRAFPQEERMRASRILVVPTAIAPAIGPVLGGLLVDWLSWRWIFWVNIPIGLAVLAFGVGFLAEQRSERSSSFDVPGFLLAGLGLAGVLYALTQGSADGWTSPEILVAGLGGLVLLGGLWLRETRAQHPMLDVRLLGNRLFGSSTLVMLLGFGAFIGTLYAFAQFQQVALGRSPLESGLLTCPEAIGVICFSQVAAHLYMRFGPRRVVAGGLLGTALFTAVIALETAATPLPLVLLVMFALGASMANIFISLQTAAFAQISTASTGHVSSLYNAIRQTGAALGVSVLATVISVVSPGTPSALLGALSPSAGNDPYQAAFLTASGITLVAFALAATMIRDTDASATRATVVRERDELPPLPLID